MSRSLYADDYKKLINLDGPKMLVIKPQAETGTFSITVQHQKVASHHIPYITVKCHDTPDTSLHNTRLAGKKTMGEADHEAVPKDTAKDAMPKDFP